MVVGIAALCLAVGVIAVKAGSDIVLAKATGQVEVRSHQATWKSVSTGTSLHFGDVIRTGAQSKAEIRFESGIIRMYENTILELPSQSPQLKVSDDSGQLKKVFLQRGRSLFEVFKNRLSGGFEVASPSLITGVKGTTFRVTEEEGLKGVTVFEGIVSVTNRQRPEETFDIRSNHYTLLSEGHLISAREFQSEHEPRSGEGLESKRLQTQDRDFQHRDIDDIRVQSKHSDMIEERRLETRLEERLTDLLEENRDLQAEALSSSLRIDTSTTATSPLLNSTLNPTGTVVSGITGTLSGTPATTQPILSSTTGTVTGTVPDASATLSGVTGTWTGVTSTIISLP